MHVSLTLVIGVLVAVGAFLVYLAIAGASLVGLNAADEAALAATLFAVAAIIIVIFAAGFKAQFSHVRTGQEALIGAHGTATTALEPKGTVRVLSEFWEAKTKDQPIPAGAEVEVLALDGMTLVVKAAEQKA